MEFTNAYKRAVGNAFHQTTSNGTVNTELSKDPIFNLYSVIDTSKDVYEIPTLLLSRITSIAINSFSLLDNSKIVAPMYKGEHFNVVRKTGDAILKLAFSGNQDRTRLRKIKTKTVSYYGAKGIILNADFKPLVLCTVQASTKESSDGEVKYIQLHGGICHVHPDVFMENTILNKVIIKKLIPYFSTIKNVGNDCDKVHIRNVHRGIPVKIEVAEFDNLFSKHKRLSPSTMNKEAVDAILNKYVSEITDKQL